MSETRFTYYRAWYVRIIRDEKKIIFSLSHLSVKIRNQIFDKADCLKIEIDHEELIEYLHTSIITSFSLIFLLNYGKIFAKLINAHLSGNLNK